MGNSAKVQIEIWVKDLTQGALKSIRAGISGLGSALSELGKAAAAISAAIFGFERFASAGERDIAISERFTGAMQSLGLSSDTVLKKLTAASGGLIEQSQVMADATQAMKGGKFTLDETALAMEFLRLKAVSLGKDVQQFTAEGIDSLSRGMARGLMPILPDLHRQLEDPANSGVDGASQKSEVLRLVFQHMASTLPELQSQVGDTSSAAQQFGTTVKDAFSDLAAGVAKSPEAKSFFTDLTAVIKDATPWVAKLLDGV